MSLNGTVAAVGRYAPALSPVIERFCDDIDTPRLPSGTLLHLSLGYFRTTLGTRAFAEALKVDLTDRATWHIKPEVVASLDPVALSLDEQMASSFDHDASFPDTGEALNDFVHALKQLSAFGFAIFFDLA